MQYSLVQSRLILLRTLRPHNARVMSRFNHILIAAGYTYMYVEESGDKAGKTAYLNYDIRNSLTAEVAE